MDLSHAILEHGQRARAAARALARLTSAQKNAGLLAMADALLSHEAVILGSQRRRHGGRPHQGAFRRDDRPFADRCKAAGRHGGRRPRRGGAR